MFGSIANVSTCACEGSTPAKVFQLLLVRAADKHGRLGQGWPTNGGTDATATVGEIFS